MIIKTVFIRKSRLFLYFSLAYNQPYGKGGMTMADKNETLDAIVKRLDDAEKEYAEKAKKMDLDALLKQVQQRSSPAG